MVDKKDFEYTSFRKIIVSKYNGISLEEEKLFRFLLEVFLPSKKQNYETSFSSLEHIYSISISRNFPEVDFPAQIGDAILEIKNEKGDFLKLEYGYLKCSHFLASQKECHTGYEECSFNDKCFSINKGNSCNVVTSYKATLNSSNTLDFVCLKNEFDHTKQASDFSNCTVSMITEDELHSIFNYLIALPEFLIYVSDFYNVCEKEEFNNFGKLLKIK